MKIISWLGCFFISIAIAQPQSTLRTLKFDNDKVKVWETIIYPNVNQSLSMHRHDSDRIIIALSDGKLKIVTDKNESHYLVLKKEQAYYLTKDKPNEMHSDENMSGHPIKVMVIELKS